MNVSRWFVRCYDCCAVAAVDRSPVEQAYWQGTPIGQRYAGPACSCGGRMHNMGKVQGNRLVLESERCACDSRCTNAAGPNCDCVCQGANHGTRRIVCVKVDAGGIPTVQAGDPEAAAELRAGIEAAKVRIAALPFYADIIAGRWVNDRAAWESIRAAQHRLNKVRSYKTHKSRMTALAKV